MWLSYLPCMIKNECCNSNNDNIDIVYVPNNNLNPNINSPNTNNRNNYKLLEKTIIN